MKDYNFILRSRHLWVFVLIDLSLVIYGAFARIQHRLYSDNILTSGITLAFVIWTIILSDIISNNITNKIFWILAMMFLPGVTPLIYLLRRNALLISR